MNNDQLISSITEFAIAKNVDRPTVVRMLRNVLRDLIERKFGSENNFDVIIDPKKGDLQIWRSRIVVPDDTEEKEWQDKIKLSEAQAIEADFEIGEEVAERVGIDSFGRRAVMEALQLLRQRRHTLEKNQRYEQYSRLVGKIITVEVGYSSTQHTILYDDDKEELLLPRSEQIPRERFKKGTYIKVLVESVENNSNGVNVVLSRTSPRFLQELISLEIPEILDNIVIVKGVARTPGVRSKVIVESLDDRIDAAGACIGPNGQRIQAISRDHLNGERIDIITYSTNLEFFIKRIIGFPVAIKIEKKSNGLFIQGQEGQMSTLYQAFPFLTQLFEMPVHIVQEGETTIGENEDVHLDEFTNEIDPKIIRVIKNIGLTTAKSVLGISKETLATKTGLKTTVIETLYRSLAKEFER